MTSHNRFAIFYTVTNVTSGESFVDGCGVEYRGRPADAEAALAALIAEHAAPTPEGRLQINTFSGHFVRTWHQPDMFWGRVWDGSADFQQGRDPV